MIDEAYAAARAAGALGGKILGAGGGGFFVFFVPPFQRYRLYDALGERGLRSERVHFEEAGLRSWKTRVRDGASHGLRAAAAERPIYFDGNIKGPADRS
jgi:hypothetical protein